MRSRFGVIRIPRPPRFTRDLDANSDAVQSWYVKFMGNFGSKDPILYILRC